MDASFGPPHEGYRSVQGIMMTHGGNPIMWASTRQPFITSTAEAELLAYSEAYQCGESAGARLEALGYGLEPVWSLEDKALEASVGQAAGGGARS